MKADIDRFSHDLGVCEAFCEVVKAGVKRIALSHPFTGTELLEELHGDEFLSACEEIAEKYGCRTYHLREPLITDLFPVSMNLGKQNIVFYRNESDIDELLSIQRKKAELLLNGEYSGEARRMIAVRYGHLLSYSDEAIERYLTSNNETE